MAGKNNNWYSKSAFGVVDTEREEGYRGVF
jgi:hypothetical protein